MKTLSQRRRRREVMRQAAEYFLDLQSDSQPTENRTEFIDWLRESPLHVSEFLRIARLHGTFAHYSRWTSLRRPSRQELAEDVIRRLPGSENTPSRGVKAGRKDAGWRFRVAAAVAMGCLVGVVAIGELRLENPRYATQAEQRMSVQLKDGSTVDLAPDSQIIISFSRNRRQVSLRRGEALFHVAKDLNRPFLVSAAITHVRATGTAFDVAREAKSIAVTVVEGTVRLTTDRQRTTESATALNSEVDAIAMSANQQVVVSLATGSSTAVRSVDGDSEVAWTTGKLAFDHKSVAEVIKSFNRYNRLQLEVMDATLASMQVTGSFRINDPDAFVAFLATIANVRVVNQLPSRILIYGQIKAR